MANVRSANTFFIDATTPTLPVKNIKVTHVTITTTAAAGVLVLSDLVTASKKLQIHVSADKTTQIFRFTDNPIVFPNGIDPTTVTNCVVTLNIMESRG